MVLPLLLALHSRLCVGDDHGSLRHLHRVLTQTDTALAERRRAIHLRAHVGQNPLHCQTRTRNGSRWRRYLKRTSGNDELVRRQCRRCTADFHANVGADDLHGTAMRAHQSRRDIQSVSRHDHITSHAPLFTFTDAEVTSTFPAANSLTTPDEPTVCSAPPLSVLTSDANVTFDPLVVSSFISSLSSSMRSVNFSVFQILIAAPPESGNSLSPQKQPLQIGKLGSPASNSTQIPVPGSGNE